MEAKEKSVTLRGRSEITQSGVLYYTEWDPSEVKSRAIKRTAKFVGMGLAACLVILFIPGVHWSLVVLLPAVLGSAIPLFIKFSGEGSNFDRVEGTCPNCNKPVSLEPFTDSKLRDEIKLICPECGQNSTAI